MLPLDQATRSGYYLNEVNAGDTTMKSITVGHWEIVSRQHNWQLLTEHPYAAAAIALASVIATAVLFNLLMPGRKKTVRRPARQRTTSIEALQNLAGATEDEMEGNNA